MTEPLILAELFRADHIQRLAWYGWTAELASAIPVLATRTRLADDASIGDVLEAAFRILLREYPVEYIYKSCILKRTIFGRNNPSTTALYMEFPIAEARADLLLVNGTAEVYEVKTRFDSPSRLTAQVNEYYRCFDLVSVIVDEADVADYVRMLPEHVGVGALTTRFSISPRRPATPYPEKLDSAAMFTVLRQAEYYKVATELGVNIKEVDPAHRYQVALQRFLRLSTADAQTTVVKALQTRQRTTQLARLCQRLPRCLHAGVFSYRLRKRDWMGLSDVLDKHAET